MSGYKTSLKSKKSTFKSKKRCWHCGKNEFYYGDYHVTFDICGRPSELCRPVICVNCLSGQNRQDMEK